MTMVHYFIKHKHNLLDHVNIWTAMMVLQPSVLRLPCLIAGSPRPEELKRTGNIIVINENYNHFLVNDNIWWSSGLSNTMRNIKYQCQNVNHEIFQFRSGFRKAWMVLKLRSLNLMTSHLKGTVAWDPFSHLIIYVGWEIRLSNLFMFWSWFHSWPRLLMFLSIEIFGEYFFSLCAYSLGRSNIFSVIWDEFVREKKNEYSYSLITLKFFLLRLFSSCLFSM